MVRWSPKPKWLGDDEMKISGGPLYSRGALVNCCDTFHHPCDRFDQLEFRTVNMELEKNLLNIV